MSNLKLERFKKYIQGRKAAVIGVGISNKPLIVWLAGLGCEITAFDAHDTSEPAIDKTVKEFEEKIILNYIIVMNRLSLFKVHVHLL